MADEVELSCREAARLISITFERVLTEEESVQLKFHLGDCDDCQHYEVQLKFLHEAAARYRR
ncbi:MAG: zf-HC2 domain-containing protein [Betaproteobacteria bacterium]|nr:zf-HC2 domain-containing protein [Betaproteobacteria bacterium]